MDEQENRKNNTVIGCRNNKFCFVSTLNIKYNTLEPCMEVPKKGNRSYFGTRLYSRGKNDTEYFCKDHKITDFNMYTVKDLLKYIGK